MRSRPTKKPVRGCVFAVEQWMAATAPSNFLAFNVEAQQKAIETKGESIAKGLQNLLHDIRQGHVSMTDESQFEVGAMWPPPKVRWCSRTSCSS
jgi:poly(3-hydroxyalkanoate) synthetase